MKSLNFSLSEGLPTLAWCAELVLGADSVQIYHGSGVEVQADGFVEGAWDGDYSAGDFDRAETMVGSGGRMRASKLIFSPPTNMFMGLASLRLPDRLLISNSVVFALVRANDQPAVGYPFYILDSLTNRRWGLRTQPPDMPTENGNRLSWHTWHNISVAPDLSLHISPRPLAPNFDHFEAYQAYLQKSVQAVFKNGNDPRRKRRYQPVAMISQGYDSPAVAAVAASAGCQRALTFENRPRGPRQLTDNGTEIAQHLGMSIQVYRLQDYRTLAGLQDAEFCATFSQGEGAPLTLAEDQLAGTILCEGRPGEDVWGLDERYNVPDLMSPPSRTSITTSYSEFRLRVGYLHFSMPYVGALQREHLQRISESETMKPWSIGGDYDRPIPRRLAEEAGVPRDAFGQFKMASSYRRPHERSQVSRESFHSFIQELDIPGWVSAGRRPLAYFKTLPLDLLYALSLCWPGKRRRLYKWLLPLTLRSDRRLKDRPALDLYLFHWGFDQIKDRYQPEPQLD
jgi:hypothetical protein